MNEAGVWKALEIVRFELAHQLRRRSNWVLFALFLFPLIGVAGNDLAEARTREILYQAPLFVAQAGLIMGLVALIIVAVVAGDAATRDVRTRMEPLMRAAPLRRDAYLGGRFLGAFLVAASLNAVVPVVRALVPLIQADVPAEVVGPFSVAGHLQAYFLLTLPNAFIATALLFALATVVRHRLGSWFGAALLLAAVQFSQSYIGDFLGRWDLARMFDPTGLTAIDVMRQTWSPPDLSHRLIGTEGVLLWNRALWLVVAGGALLLAYRRMDFGRGAGALRWWQIGPLHPSRSGSVGAGGADPDSPMGAGGLSSAPVTVPRAPRAFGTRGRVGQTLAITRDSLREMAPPWTWVLAPGLVWAQSVLTVGALETMGAGSPVLPTTEMVLRTLLPGAGDAPPPVILAIVLLPILLAGELIWRERDANLQALADATPVPDGVRFVGKLIGLGIVIAGLQILLVLGGLLAQLRLGGALQPGLVVGSLGLGLMMPLAFALFALSVHVLVNQKQLGTVVCLLMVAPLVGELLGVEHPLLIVGWVPAWSHSPIRGFGPFLGPVLWFQLYWTAWALSFACVALSFWVRGVEAETGGRWRVARRRLEGARVGALVAAGSLLLLVGGVIFYNTNVLNDYRAGAAVAEEKARYERTYGKYEGALQPHLVATELEVELHPDVGEARVEGMHLLANRSDRAIDTLHVATSSEVETREIELDRPARLESVDDGLAHRVYVLAEPLRPGDSLRLTWNVRYAPRGFPARGSPTAVVGNGSFIVMGDWMPLIGYQPGRELADPGQRIERGLPPRATVPSLEDPTAPFDRHGMDHLDLSVTIGTSAGQTAVAPGELVRSWTENGRAWFQYETRAPIGNGYALFSAAYAVTRGRWGDVAIEVLHHAAHDGNVPRMIRGMEASLEQFTERFGPFPHPVLRMVEYPAAGGSLHAASGMIWYQEMFSLFDPDRDSRRIDMPFAVTAHEVAHQFQPVPARTEGRVLLSESFAWYAALGVIEEEYGSAHLERFLDFMRRSYLTPRSRADVPLVRAHDSFQGYRKGPFAMYALREYVGQDRVDLAWRRLRERHASHEPPFATSLDLYRELQNVTPEAQHTLLGDLLERNTFWELTAEAATAHPTADDRWRVTLQIEANKVVVDTLGTETDVPMDDLVEIGLSGPAGADGARDLLYRAMHRIRSGRHSVTITVPVRPARAAIDPRHLLIDVRPGDNVVDVVEPPPEGD